MNHLSKLSPAETLFVLQGHNATIKELLKVTFMDLLLKQVVRTVEVQRQPSRRDTIRIYRYVLTGKNFNSYKPLPHENIFLAPFQKKESAQILFRHLVKMGYQNAQSQSILHSTLRKSPNIDGCVSRNPFQIIFGGFYVTPKGFELRNTIQSEIRELEEKLPPLINEDLEKARDILKVIRGNIFLLTSIEFALLNQIDTQLLSEMNKRNATSDGIGCSGCTWDSFDSYTDSFNSSCSGDSGCSGGGSGCSGCGSGCSGCGGGCGGS